MPLEIGRGRIVREGGKVALLSFGARLAECLKAAEELDAYGLSTTVADARFAKPLDTDLIDRLAREHEVLITVEEGAVGGFGAMCSPTSPRAGALDRGLKVRHARPARPLRRPGQAGGDVRRAPGSTRPASCAAVFAALGRAQEMPARLA